MKINLPAEVVAHFDDTAEKQQQFPERLKAFSAKFPDREFAVDLAVYLFSTFDADARMGVAA